LVRVGAKATRTPKSTSPTASPAIIEIAARHCLEPYRQGELDALCGLYGPINALRLALANTSPLSKARCKTLLVEGAELLDRKMGFAAAAVSGIGTKRRLALVRQLAKLVSTSKFIVTVERPDREAWSSIDDVLDWITVSLAHGKPVLIALAGGVNHFTVVAGMTPTALQLFDSCGQQFIRKSSLGLGGRYYRVPLNGLLRIAVEQSR
jgi:hypothetical protein